MACEHLDLFDPGLPDQVANEVLIGVQNKIKASGLKAIPRAYVGVGPIPAEDCCPDLVVWVSNFRLWDSAVPDTLQEGRVLSHYGVAFNVSVRVGDCYWELIPTEKSFKPDTPANISKKSSQINRYGYAAFLGAIEAMTALGQCDLSFTPYQSDPFQQGGCAGFTFSFAVSII